MQSPHSSRNTRISNVRIWARGRRASNKESPSPHFSEKPTEADGTTWWMICFGSRPSASKPEVGGFQSFLESKLMPIWLKGFPLPFRLLQRGLPSDGWPAVWMHSSDPVPPSDSVSLVSLMQVVTTCHCLAYRRIHRTCQSRLVQPLPVVTEPRPFALPGAKKLAKFLFLELGVEWGS